MLARGFDGELPVGGRPAFRTADAGFVCAAAALAVAVRILFR
jgi:hypothetical protein